MIARIGNAIRGTIYGALGLEAFRLLRGMRGSNGDEAELWTARLLEVPFGAVLLGIAGVAVAVYGASELINSLRGAHDPKVDWSRVGPGVRKICRFGVGVRGGLIVTLGVFLVRAALTDDPGQAAGSRESLLRLGGLVDGRWFLGILAIGLVAYAVDQAVHARWRRIRRVV